MKAKFNRNELISRRLISAVAKFNKDLAAFAGYTEEAAAELYEDALTSYTLENVRIENGRLCYEFDGREEAEDIVILLEDGEDNGEEENYILREDEIREFLNFHRANLRRAKKYFSMSAEDLDALQEKEANGEAEEEAEEVTEASEGTNEAEASEEASEAEEVSEASEEGSRAAAFEEYIKAKMLEGYNLEIRRDEAEASRAAEAAALLAEDAEIFASRAESWKEEGEAAAVHEYAKEASEAAAKAKKRAARAAEFSAKAKTEAAAAFALEAANFAAKAEAAAKRANIAAEEAYEAAAVEYRDIAADYEGQRANVLSCLQAASEAQKNEIRSRAALLAYYSAEYTKRANEAASRAAGFKPAASDAAAKVETAEAKEAASDAADMIKTAAAVSAGFICFYLLFAIFGI